MLNGYWRKHLFNDQAFWLNRWRITGKGYEEGGPIMNQMGINLIYWYKDPEKHTGVDFELWTTMRVDRNMVGQVNHATSMILENALTFRVL